MRRVLVAVAVLIFLPLVATSAQQAATGRIVGRVIDAATGAGLAAAGIQVVGTTIGTQSGVDGRFTIVGVPAGTVTLAVRRIGYAPKTVTGLFLEAGKTIEQDVTLAQASLELAAQVVTASAERGSVNEALDQQRNATGIVSAVTQEQISRSPDGDAAKAIQRVSGVTVQDGKSVFVRGLGERYTVTNLNGARLPSPEPEKRFVPLDLFPSNLLQSVNVSKTFTPDLSGDFSGASVDIRTREYPARRQFTFSSSLGFNDAVTGQNVVGAPRVGSEWLGFGGSARNLPTGLASAGAVGQLGSREQINGAINQLRNAWTPTQMTGLPAGSFAASVGGQDPIGGLQIGYLGSFTYSASQDIRRDDYQSNPVQRDGRPEVLEAWRGQGTSQSTTWGGLLNFSSLVTPRTLLSWNNTYTRSSDNDARRSSGPAYNFGLAEVERMTLRFVERAIYSSQLKGEHSLTARQQFDWTASTAGVSRKEPDRSDLVYVQFGGAGDFAWSDGNPDVARRTFGDLQENNVYGAVNYRYQFGDGSDAPLVKVGAAYRTTNRSAFNRQFSIISTLVPVTDRSRPAEELFDGRFTSGNDDVFNIINVAEDGIYDASERLGAAYVMTEIPFGYRVRLIAGARVEDADITVSTALSNASRFESRLQNVDVLPAIVLNVQVGSRSQLRASASQTLARPEYRELSPVQYLEMVGGQVTRGNADLVRTLIQNYDLKFESFLASGELFSIGLFAKRFDRPIERIDVATGGQPLVSFFNAASATNLGVELEYRKGLGSLVRALEPYAVFTNLTLMQSTIEVGDGASSNTNADRPMMGQAPWVANVGLSRTGKAAGSSATLLYSAVGPRIFAAGTVPFPDVIEQPRHMVDFSVRLPMGERWGWKFDARNLLDAPYQLTQGPITRESFRSGRQFAMGLSWR
jgi:hypothetical protein